MADERDMAEQLETIRADITTLTATVSRLVTDIAGIQTSLIHGRRSAVGDALNETGWLTGPAMHPARGGIVAAIARIEAEIERNPLIAVLVALWAGKAVGRFTRK